MLSDQARSALMQSSEMQALEQALNSLSHAETQHRPVEMAVSLAQVAHGYRGMGELDAAHHYLERALPWAECSGSADTEVRLLCELTELGCDRADQQRNLEHKDFQSTLERMRDHAFQAAQRAASVSDGDWEVKVLLRVSDVLERCGDHQDACALQARAMRLMVGESGALPPPDLHLLRQAQSD